ncbi:MAG: hypothetical protein EKK48_01875 [Candidatus Melainabacteria bacterium]|nr:MAG: hypothetical protein EKK48_01875 [Candidatus Melainabacteria bacterium]
MANTAWHASEQPYQRSQSDRCLVGDGGDNCRNTLQDHVTEVRTNDFSGNYRGSTYYGDSSYAYLPKFDVFSWSGGQAEAPVLRSLNQPPDAATLKQQYAGDPVGLIKATLVANMNPNDTQPYETSDYRYSDGHPAVGKYGMGSENIQAWIDDVAGQPIDNARIDQSVQAGRIPADYAAQLKNPEFQQGLKNFVTAVDNGSDIYPEQIDRFMPPQVQDLMADDLAHKFIVWMDQLKQQQAQQNDTPQSGAAASGPLAATLAKDAMDVAMSMGGTQSQGLCYTGVGRAAAECGITLTGVPAYVAADQLAAMPDKFQEIDSHSQLQPGDIVVHNKGNSEYGHIAIVEPNGQEASDFVTTLIPVDAAPWGGSRVFRPIA